MTLIVNNNEIWMKEKVNEIHLHPLTDHIYCHL
jgi:FMN phosphatase YigB (HAD superfamily)